jgi:hypothetical protein
MSRLYHQQALPQAPALISTCLAAMRGAMMALSTLVDLHIGQATSPRLCWLS